VNLIDLFDGEIRHHEHEDGKDDGCAVAQVLIQFFVFVDGLHNNQDAQIDKNK
jgi:hypothetical protein